jgi:PAS domain S-box-containing protein
MTTKSKQLLVPARMLALALIYYGAAKFGLTLAKAHVSVSPVRPPTGIAIGALLLLGYRYWPGILLGALLANYLKTDNSVLLASGIAIGNTGEAVAAALLLRSMGFRNSLDRARDVGAFIFAVLTATTLSATVGNLSLSLGHAEKWTDFGSLWVTWWMGDVVGALVLAPLILVWATRSNEWLPKERYIEATLVLAVLALAATVTFAKPTPAPIQYYPLTRLIVPFFLWGSLRLGQRGITLASMILSAFAIWGASQGLGPFVVTGRSSNEAFLQLQLFVGSNAVTFLFLAAVVAERRSSALALWQSEQQLNVALQAANMGAWNYDVRTGVVEWSRNLELLHGIPPGSFGGTFAHFLEDVHSDDRNYVIDSLTRNIERGAQHEIEYRIVRPGGSIRWVEGKGTSLLDNAGKTVGMSGVCMDVTDRKQVEKERELMLIREQAARIEAERSTLIIKRLQAVTDSALRHLALDDLLQEMLQRVRELLNVESVAVLLLAEDGKTLILSAGIGLETELATDVRIPLGQGIAGRIASTRLPLVVADLANADVYNPILRDNLSSLVGAPLIVKGKVIGVIHADTIAPRQFTEEDLRVLELVADRVALAIDHSRLYEAELRARIAAEEASRMKDEFLATVSHELRTPLNAIVGWSGMLRAGRLDEATSRRAVEIIDRNAKVQTQLIEDILDVSRIITGKLRLETGPVELLPVIEAAVDSLRPALNSKAILLDVISDSNTGPVLGDLDRLQQVVWNLLANAVKFTSAKGRIEVRLQNVEAEAEIAVRDNGQGISEDFLPYVFDRFRQADGAITRKHGGLGLGLAIVRHLVELHGGSIRAESGGEGKGATFVVRLPLLAGRMPTILEHRETAYASELSLPSQFDLSGLEIMVVDDEVDARELCTAILSNCGAQVKAFGAAPEALKVLREWRPDAIISDLEMPEVDGYAFMRQVRAMELGQPVGIPSVALTAYARAEDRMQALEAGFHIHISKPADPAELAAIVCSLTGRVKKNAAVDVKVLSQAIGTTSAENSSKPETQSVNHKTD